MFIIWPLFIIFLIIIDTNIGKKNVFNFEFKFSRMKIDTFDYMQTYI